ncbi:MAG: sigma-70 family RNA polymerase sigma factor [bacterium]
MGPDRTDEVLVEEVREGRERALEELIERYRSRVYRLAYRFTSEKEDAEEVVQEVFMTLYRKLDRFEGKSSFSTWLYRVTVNASLMKLRGQGQAELVSIDELSEDHFQHDEEGPNPDETIMTEEALSRIERAVGRLPDEFKTVVILRDIEGFSNEETAQILDISTAAVKSRVHRGRAYLRKRLKDLYEETVKH